MIASTFFISLLSVSSQTGRAGRMPARRTASSLNHSPRMPMVQDPPFRACVRTAPTNTWSIQRDCGNIQSNLQRKHDANGHFPLIHATASQIPLGVAFLEPPQCLTGRRPINLQALAGGGAVDPLGLELGLLAAR